MGQPLTIAPYDLLTQRQERAIYRLVQHGPRIAVWDSQVLVRLIHKAGYFHPEEVRCVRRSLPRFSLVAKSTLWGGARLFVRREC